MSPTWVSVAVFGCVGFALFVRIVRQATEEWVKGAGVIVSVFGALLMLVVYSIFTTAAWVTAAITVSFLVPSLPDTPQKYDVSDSQLLTLDDHSGLCLIKSISYGTGYDPLERRRERELTWYEQQEKIPVVEENRHDCVLRTTRLLGHYAPGWEWGNFFITPAAKSVRQEFRVPKGAVEYWK